MENKIQNRPTLLWFKDHVGKTIFRRNNKQTQSVFVIDNQHAEYLYKVSQELGIEYREYPFLSNDKRKAVINNFGSWVKENYKHSKGGYRMRGDFENKGTIFNLSQLIDIFCRL